MVTVDTSPGVDEMKVSDPRNGRRPPGDTASQRVLVLEEQLAIAIAEQTTLARELTRARSLGRMSSEELEGKFDALRTAIVQLAGLLAMLSDIAAGGEQADAALAGALYVAGAAAKEIVADL